MDHDRIPVSATDSKHRHQLAGSGGLRLTTVGWRSAADLRGRWTGPSQVGPRHLARAQMPGWWDADCDARHLTLSSWFFLQVSFGIPKTNQWCIPLIPDIYKGRVYTFPDYKPSIYLVYTKNSFSNKFVLPSIWIHVLLWWFNDGYAQWTERICRVMKSKLHDSKENSGIWL